MGIFRFWSIALILLFIACPIFAQPLRVEWTRTFGGPAWDECHYVRQTNDGGYILGGRTCSWGGAAGDFLLIKTDSLGIEQWNRHYGGLSYERSRCTRQTFDGGFIIAGCTESYGSGSYDTWAVKTDANGDTLWTMLFGGSDEDRLTGVRETRDKGYIFTGFTYSFAPYGRNALAIKTDYFGQIEWWQTFGGSGDDFFLDVCETSQNEFMFVGTTTSYGLGGYDFYLVVTDLFGNAIWDQTYGGAGSEMCFSILPTREGTYMLHGPTSSYGAGDRDFWLVEIQPDGQQLWNQTYGGFSYDWGVLVENTHDNGFVMFGETMSFGAGDRDYWIVKTDRSGVQEWDMPVGGPNLDITWCGQPTTDGGFILGGYSESYGAGSSDVWLVKLGPPPIDCDPPQASLTPSFLDFDVVPVGESLSRFFIISNPDSCALDVYSITAPDGYEVDFNGPLTLYQGDNYAVRTTFSPLRIGEYTGEVVVHTNAIQADAVLEVRGIGGGPAISIEPVTLDFGDVAVDSSRTLPLTVSSVGTMDLIISDVYSFAPFADDFTETLILPPGASRIFNVTFAPEVEATYEDVLIVFSNIEQSSSVVQLLGNAIPTGITDNAGLTVTNFALNGVYPNPFNPSTTISFDVPSPADVRVTVYDITGRKVTDLLSGPTSAGHHSLNWSCPDCATGVYMVAMSSGEFRAVTKALFVK